MSDVQAEINSKSIQTFLRGAVAFCAMLYFFGAASARTLNGFFDSLNLTFHEAGHTLAFLFSDLVVVLAGSVFQVLVPLVLSFYFYVRGAKYSGSLLLFWVGQSIVSVSIYASDALRMNLPLLGGENSIHDWNYIFSTLGLLDKTESISMVIYSVGIVTLITASALSFYYARPPRRHDLLMYAGAVITHEGKVLVVQEMYDEALGLWSLPVTPLQKKEEVADAAKRVVAEEAGYTAGLFSVPTVVLTSGINMRAPHEEALCSIKVYLFNGTVVGECRPKEGLVQGVRWVLPKDIDELSFRAEWMRLFIRSAFVSDGRKSLQ